jgi:hypothetical protein
MLRRTRRTIRDKMFERIPIWIKALVVSAIAAAITFGPLLLMFHHNIVPYITFKPGEPAKLVYVKFYGPAPAHPKNCGIADVKAPGGRELGVPIPCDSQAPKRSP